LPIKSKRIHMLGRSWLIHKW